MRSNETYKLYKMTGFYPVIYQSFV